MFYSTAENKEDAGPRVEGEFFPSFCQHLLTLYFKHQIHVVQQKYSETTYTHLKILETHHHMAVKTIACIQRKETTLASSVFKLMGNLMFSALVRGFQHKICWR